MRSIYKIARVSKQSAHKYFKHEDELSKKLSDLLVEADELKEESRVMIENIRKNYYESKEMLSKYMSPQEHD